MGKKIYYHFSNGRLRYEQGNSLPIESGYEYYEAGRPIMCRHGMHASLTVLDALAYAPGNILSKTNLYGRDYSVEHRHDKAVAECRYVIAVADITDILRKFARMCALDVIHLWDAPDVAVRYLKTGDESLRRAAHTEARSAALTAAYSGPLSAPRSAALSALRSAAYSGPLSAAHSAAHSAACSAPRLKLREKQNDRLMRMISKADWE